jgi:hypothetical protein
MDEKMTKQAVLKGLRNALKLWVLGVKDRELLREAIRIIRGKDNV